MKLLLLYSFFTGFFLVETVQAQDTCKVFGQKNPHGVAMEIKAPMTVTDTINFSVQSLKALPYNIGATDTIFFDVCIRARDGNMHTTQVRYGTTHGVVSYTVKMQAPSTAGVGNSETLSNRMSLFPNPANNFIRLKMESFPSNQMQLIITDEKGSLVKIHTIFNSEELLIPTSDLTNGNYHAIVKSGKNIIGSIKFIIVR